jgi:hypothetical protein
MNHTFAAATGATPVARVGFSVRCGRLRPEPSWALQAGERPVAAAIRISDRRTHG